MASCHYGSSSGVSVFGSEHEYREAETAAADVGVGEGNDGLQRQWCSGGAVNIDTVGEGV